jgi:hypothetical protein
VLNSWGEYATRSAYTPEICRRILWAVLHDGRQFFDNKLLSTAFTPGKTVLYPMCLLIILDKVFNAETNRPLCIPIGMVHGSQAKPPDPPQGTAKHPSALVMACTTKRVRGSPGACWMPNQPPTTTTTHGQASPADSSPHGLVPGGAQQ